MEKFVDVEEVTPLERFLGRHHEFVNGTVADFAPPADENRASNKNAVRGLRFDMAAYARQAVDMYVRETGVKTLRAAATPFCPEGSLTTSDDDIEGEVSHAACAILMKMLWLGRLARPDIIRAIAGLASKV